MERTATNLVAVLATVFGGAAVVLQALQLLGAPRWIVKVGTWLAALATVMSFAWWFGPLTRESFALAAVAWVLISVAVALDMFGRGGRRAGTTFAQNTGLDPDLTIAAQAVKAAMEKAKALGAAETERDGLKAAKDVAETERRNAARALREAEELCNKALKDGQAAVDVEATARVTAETERNRLKTERDGLKAAKDVAETERDGLKTEREKTAQALKLYWNPERSILLLFARARLVIYCDGKADLDVYCVVVNRSPAAVRVSAIRFDWYTDQNGNGTVFGKDSKEYKRGEFSLDPHEHEMRRIRVDGAVSGAIGDKGESCVFFNDGYATIESDNWNGKEKVERVSFGDDDVLIAHVEYRVR